MRRRVFPALCLLSLALFLLFVIAWVRSYFHAEWVMIGRATETLHFSSEDCSLHVARSPIPGLQYDLLMGAPFRYLYYGPFRDESPHRPVWRRVWGRFDWTRGPPEYVAIPYWLPTLFTALLPAAWVARRGVPKWVRYAPAVGFGLWPLVAAAVGFTAHEDFGAVWLIVFAAFPAVLLLGLRDAGRPHAGPWPWQWRRHRRWERKRRGLCTECGYDLRGGHDRCPECGHPVAEAQAASPAQ